MDLGGGAEQGVDAEVGVTPCLRPMGEGMRERGRGGEGVGEGGRERERYGWRE